MQKTQSWVQFLGIASIVIACLAGLALVIGALALPPGSKMFNKLVIGGIVIFVVSVLYAIFWLKYSGALKRLSDDGSVTREALDGALTQQRRLWLFQGILFIFVLIAIGLQLAGMLVAWA
ncbi:MAG: hypothetical protein L0H63_16515 [Nitrococcus sp.]|nr:hypothetical protein [Nitrococcus sp.]